MKTTRVVWGDGADESVTISEILHFTVGEEVFLNLNSFPRDKPLCVKSISSHLTPNGVAMKLAKTVILE